MNRASGPRGAAWTNVTGGTATAIVTDGGIQVAESADQLEYNNTVNPGERQFSEVVIRGTQEDGGTQNGCGAAARIQSDNSGYIMLANRQDALVWRIYRQNAGSIVALQSISSAIDPVSGDLGQLRVYNVGGNPVLEMWVNGIWLNSPGFTDSNASKLLTGRVGDFGSTFNVVTHWNNWRGGDLDDILKSPNRPLALQQRMAA